MNLHRGTLVLFTGTIFTVSEERTVGGIRLVEMVRRGGRGLTWRRDALVDMIHRGGAEIITGVEAPA